MATTAGTIARRWFEEVWNARRAETIDELLAPDAVAHMEGGDVHGPAQFREAHAMFLNALPDISITIEDVISDGDHAVVRWRVRATHKGDFFGIAATNAPVDFRGMSWAVVKDGKVVEGFDTWNLGGLVESLRSAAKS